MMYRMMLVSALVVLAQIPENTYSQDEVCGVNGERGQGANQGSCTDEKRCQYTGECKAKTCQTSTAATDCPITQICTDDVCGDDAGAGVYTQTTEMACKNVDDTFGIYNDVVAAKKACENDPNCGKVCDKYCNGNVITLCVKGTAEIVSDDIRSCLYKHERDSYPCSSTADCATGEYCNEERDPSVCASLSCNANQFQCDNGNCIDEPKCNFVDNCGDNSDEQNCEYGSLISQVLGALEAESCDQLELDQIKATIAAELNIDASNIAISCEITRRQQVKKQDQFVQSNSFHPTVLLKVSVDDGNRKRLMDLMGNVNQFVTHLNSNLPEELNDFAFANKPSIDTQV